VALARGPSGGVRSRSPGPERARKEARQTPSFRKLLCRASAAKWLPRSLVEYVGLPSWDTTQPPTETPASPASIHTTSVIIRSLPRRERRRWTAEQKQMIAAQSLAPGASPTNVTRPRWHARHPSASAWSDRDYPARRHDGSGRRRDRSARFAPRAVRG
jgi:hypothetical protein